jgi:hypothetical protein
LNERSNVFLGLNLNIHEALHPLRKPPGVFAGLEVYEPPPSFFRPYNIRWIRMTIENVARDERWVFSLPIRD